MNAGEPLFVDTAAWVALFHRDDTRHEQAARYWQELREEHRFLLTSDYVLDEAYTLLRRARNGLAMAVAFHDLVERSEVLGVVYVDEDLLEEAWRIFVGHEDKVLSFTDSVSFALMRRRGLFEVFTFDADFERAGFLVRPGPPARI